MWKHSHCNKPKAALWKLSLSTASPVAWSAIWKLRIWWLKDCTAWKFVFVKSTVHFDGWIRSHVDHLIHNSQEQVHRAAFWWYPLTGGSRLMGDTLLMSQPYWRVIFGYLEKIESWFGFVSQKHLLELPHVTAQPFVSWTTHHEIKMVQRVVGINYSTFWFLLLVKLQMLRLLNHTGALACLKWNYMFLSPVVWKQSTHRKRAHPHRSETKQQMKNPKLIVSKNTYFNVKADLRSFQADSGLSCLLPFHVPRLQHRQCSHPSLGESTLGFALSSYSVLKMRVEELLLLHKAAMHYILACVISLPPTAGRSTACLSFSPISFYSVLPISQSLLLSLE